MNRRDEARRLQREGMSIRKIAERLDLPPMTVWGWLPTEEERGQFAAMARLRDMGLSYEEIGKRLNVNKQRVSVVLGSVPRRKTKGQKKVLDLAPATWQGARQVAARLGLLAISGGRMGSVGMLLDAIASGEIELTWAAGCGPNEPLREEREAA